MDEFAQGLRAFNRKAFDDATRRLRRVGFKAVETIVLRTPVKTGCARANWQVSVGELGRRADLTQTDESGGATIAKAQAKIASAKLGTDFYIENSVPYIAALENGWSRQAPVGMVDISMRELQSAIDAGAF